MEILIFSMFGDETYDPLHLISYGLTGSLWRPSFRNRIPPQKSKKYLVYWVFHYLHIFKNRDYSALLLYTENSLIASMLVVPAHFKWPFMARDDLQFTYVKTEPSFRGKGIGEMMLRNAIRQFSKENRTFWYVTDTENQASIRLCEKVGFKLGSRGKHSGILKILKEA